MFPGKAVSERKTIHCDFCGSVKGDVNHWWSLHIVQENGEPSPRPVLVIQHNENRDNVAHDALLEEADACGSECTQKGVARFLAMGTLEDVKGTE